MCSATAPSQRPRRPAPSRPRGRFRHLLLGLVASLGLAAVTASAAPPATGPSAGEPWFHMQTLKGSKSGNTADWMGRDVAIDGNRALIGAPTSRSNSTRRKGVAYFMEHDGSQWVEQQWVYGSQQTTGSGVDNFGYGVALQGDVAAIGAITVPHPTSGTRGIVYVYERVAGSWTEQAIVQAPDADAQFDRFGALVALDGDTLVVAANAYRFSMSEPNVGRVYVYVRNGANWDLQATLQADDAGAEMGFGTAIALQGDTLLVGGPGNSNLARVGTVYVFERNAGVWTQVQRIQRDAAAAGDYFGTAVTLEGDTAVIGASGAEPDGELGRGAAYVFERSNGVFTQAAELIDPDGRTLDEFGISAALHGDSVLVGSLASRTLSYEGTAFLFERSATGWRQTRQFLSPNPQNMETFGLALALSDDFALIGGPFGLAQSKVAAVYAYQRTTAGHLGFDPGTLGFGQVPVGYASAAQPAVLLNDGMSPAVVSAITPSAPDFSWTSSCGTPPFTIAAGASCTLQVVFAPSAIQTYAATLEVTSDALVSPVSLALTGQGIKPIAVLGGIQPASVTANLIEGAAATSQAITLANNGPGALGWSVFDAPADESLIVRLDHSLGQANLAGNTKACEIFTGTRETHYLRTFAPADFGATGAYHVGEVSFGVQEATVATTVRLRLHWLDGTMSFDNMRLLAEYPVAIEVQQDTHLTVPVDVDLPAGATLVLELVAPDLTSVNGKFHPGSNRDGETGPSWYAAPACNFPQPVLYSSLTGLPPPVVHLVMSASGHAIDCAVPGWLQATPDSDSVPPYASAGFSVGIDPAGLAPGSYGGRLCLASNASNRPLARIPATLDVVAAAPDLALNTPSLDFGTLDVGLDSAPLAVTLTSAGNVAVTLDGVSTALPPFQELAGTCPPRPFTLAVGDSCTLAYRFAPDSAGSASQTLSLASSAGTRTLELTGAAVQVARSVAALAGGGQQARVGTAFAQPLVVEVRDALGRPLGGVEVAFSAPASGPGATLAAASVTTDANGQAQVGATANAQAGSYRVGASVAGVADAAEFALTNRAVQADVAVRIQADRPAVRTGELVNYWVTASNGGQDPAQAVAINQTLAMQLDAAATQWICLTGAGQCAASGQGALVDSVDLAAGASIAWLVTAPVRLDAPEAPIVTSAQASAPDDGNSANDSASAVTQMVLYRDGFEPYGNGTGHPAPAAAQRLDAASLAGLAWDAGSDSDGVQTLVGIAAPPPALAQGFRIERVARGGAQWLRVVALDVTGAARAQAWQRADGTDRLWLALAVAPGQGEGRLLVGGEAAAPEWELPFATAQAALLLQPAGPAVLTLRPAETD